MADRVNIVDFTGGVKSVAPEQVEEELRRGGRLESTGEAGSRLVGDVQEQEFGGAAGALKAGAAGLARGASLGLSDVAATQLGLISPEELSAYREQNPGVSALTEIGGAVLPGLASGGSGFLGAAARATPAGALTAATGGAVARGASALGMGALEGTAYGAGQAISELALTNEPLTVESALTEIGLDTLLGAGAGAVGGVLSKGLSRVSDKLAGAAKTRSARGELGLKAFEEVESRVGPQLKTVSRQTSDLVDDLLDTAGRVSQGSPITGSPGQLKQWAQARQAALLDEANEIVAAARSANLGEKRISKLTNEISNSTKVTGTALQPGIRVDAKSFSTIQQSLNRLEGGIRDLTKKLEKQPGWTGRWKEIAQRLDDLDNKFHLATDSGQMAPRTAYEADNRPTGVPKKAQPELKALAEEVSELRAEYHRAWDIGKDDISQTTFRRFQRMSPEQAQNAVEARQAYLVKAKELADKLPHTGIGDDLVLAEKQFSEKISEAMPNAPVADLIAFHTAAKQVQGKVASAVGGSGGIAGAIKGAAALGVAYTAVGAVGLGGPAGFVAAHAISRSLLRGGSRLAQSTGAAIARIESAASKLLEGTSKVTRRSAPATLKVLNSVRFGGEDTSEKKSSREAFKDRALELAAAAVNPLGAHQKLFDGLTEIRAAHPLVADAMEMEGVKQLTFLHEKAPKDPGTMHAFGVSRWAPSEAELIKFANYVRAVSDPISVLEDAASGTVTPQAAEALRTLFPATFAEFQKTLAMNADKLQKNTSFDQRVRLSVLFKVPLDSVMSPTFLKAQQQFWLDRQSEEKPLDPNQFKQTEPSEAQRLLA